MYRWVADVTSLCTLLVYTQVREMQPLLERGLDSLSVQETGQLLSQLDLESLVSNFEENSVSNAPLF